MNIPIRKSPFPPLPNLAKKIVATAIQPFKKPSLNEIESFYSSHLKGEFVDLEQDRKKLLHLFFILSLIGSTTSLIVGIIYWKSVGAQVKGNFDLFIFLLFLINGPLFTFWLKRQSAFKKSFKDRVMKKLVEKFFPGLCYTGGACIRESSFKEANLFGDFNRYEGNDHFRGTCSSINFELSELFVRKVTGSGKNRRTVTIFQGFFFLADFHREIYFRTTIKPDEAERSFGILGRGLQRIAHGNRLVDLENPEFEKHFVVTADDQVEARYILTPKFMESILKFRNSWNCPVSLCFVNCKVFLAISTGKDYFEPRIFGEIFSRKDIMSLIDCVQLFTGLVNELNQNEHFKKNGVNHA